MSRTTINRFYGLDLRFIKDFSEEEKTEIMAKLEPELASAFGGDASKGSVHLFKIYSKARISKFNTEGIENRLETLELKIRVHDKQRAKKSMSLKHDKLKSLSLSGTQPKSAGIFHAIYDLPGELFKSGEEFQEYVAVVLEDNCRDRHKKVSLEFTAKPTQDYGSKLKISGNALSEYKFYLNNSTRIN